MTQINTYAHNKGFATGIPTGIDWKAADFETEDGRKAVVDAVNGYFEDVRGAMAGKSTRPDHVPTLPVPEEFELRQWGPRADGGISTLFREVDRRGSANPVIDFHNLNSDAIVFEQANEGQPAELARLKKGSKHSLRSVKWQGGLGIDDDARRFDAYSEFEMAVQRVPAIWRNKQDTVLAALVNALGAGINHSWTTDLTKTVNGACNQIFEDCGDDYGLDENSDTLSLLYNPLDSESVTQMRLSGYLAPNDNNSGSQLEFAIQPVKTRRLAQGTMLVALPGYDSVSGVWDDLYSEFGRDWERGFDAFVWRGRWNAAAGNIKQFRRITLQ